MAIKYPSQVDNDVSLPRINDNVTEITGSTINALGDAIKIIEKTVGTNPQGNTANLATRINSVIDVNGRLKTSALTDKGLVTLPIDDSQIDSNASIKESKLDLDHSTSSLYTSISVVETDLAALTSNQATLSSQINSHILGFSPRHDGYDIDLTSAIRSETKVESALNAINNALEMHKASDPAHAAQNITVDNVLPGIFATNVQDALFELDVAGTRSVQNLQKDLGGTGIVYNKAAEISNYGNLKNTTLASTIYETNPLDSTNILQVMRPNVARITGEEINFQALNNLTAFNIRIQAGGINRSYLDVSLSSVIPTNDLSDIISTISFSASQANYPISVYNVGNRLVIAHNIPGQEFTIEVLNTVANSAHDALGFGNSSNTQVTWGQNLYGAVFNGQRISDFKTIIKKPIVLGVTSDTINPSVGDLSLLGLPTDNTGRVLVNITSHSVDSTYNGTYYIKSFPTNATFTLNKAILAGTFNLEIVKDSVNFANSARGNIYDIFAEYDADGYGKISSSLRASYLTLSGVDIESVSEDFPTTNVEWEVTVTNYVQLRQNSLTGESKFIPSGFLGEMKLNSYDGVGEAIFNVTGNPFSGIREIIVNNFAGNENNVYLCSVHHSGNTGTAELRYVKDHRKLGVIIENYSYDDFENKTELEKAINDLRNNGVVHGFEKLSSTSNSITIAGGRAYVGGKRVDTKTRTVSVTDFSTPSGIILLDSGGNFIIKNTADPGYSSTDLIATDGYGDDRNVATILEYGTTGTGFNNIFYDRRLIIKNIDGKFLKEVQNINRRIDEIYIGGVFSATSLTTIQRNLLTAKNGMIIYNTTDNKFQGYQNGAWVDFSTI